MKPSLTEHPFGRVLLLHLERPYRFETPFDGGFVLLLTISDASVTPAEMQVLCRAIVVSGCRFVMCHGIDCEGWHDRIDDAFLEAELRSEGWPVTLTTWHPDESLQDTLAFMLTGTAADEVVPAAFAVVELGGDGSKLVWARAELDRLDRGA